jgi:hypothetical protein
LSEKPGPAPCQRDNSTDRESVFERLAIYPGRAAAARNVEVRTQPREGAAYIERLTRSVMRRWVVEVPLRARQRTREGRGRRERPKPERLKGPPVGEEC